MLKNTKTYGVILGVILFIALIVGITYAYITWKSADTRIRVESECFNINYSRGQNISNNKLYVINENNFLNGDQITIIDGMELTTVGLEIDADCNIDGTGKIMLNTSTLSDAFINGNSVGALKYKLVEYSSTDYPNVTTTDLNGEVFSVIAEGQVTAAGISDIISMELESGVKKEYMFIFYLDEVLAQNDVSGASFYGTISAEVTQNG